MKADVVNIYLILAQPWPLGTSDVMKMLEVSRPTAIKYMRQVQDFISARDGKPCDARFVTRQMVLDYEHWDWEDLQKNALAIIAAGAASKTKQEAAAR